MSQQIVSQDFYVYVHKRATDGQVFYVGKGCGSRAWCFSKRGSHWNAVAKKHGVKVDVLHRGLQEWAAFEIESDLIALHGRKDLGQGFLVNHSDGGVSGFTGGRHTEEIKERIRNVHLGKKKTEEHKAKLKKPKTESVKKILSAQKLGQKNPMFGKVGGANPASRSCKIVKNCGEELVFKSRTEACAFFNVSKQTLSRWATGFNKPSKEYNIAKIYGFL
jgi:hypothetical protein